MPRWGSERAIWTLVASLLMLCIVNMLLHHQNMSLTHAIQHTNKTIQTLQANSAADCQRKREITTEPPPVPDSGPSQDLSSGKLWTRGQKTLIVITPTAPYKRITELADLNRLQHTLQVANFYHNISIHWIVCEPVVKSQIFTNVLMRSRLSYTHLSCPQPTDPFREVSQLNCALQFLRMFSASMHPETIIYFADVANAYDERLFTEMFHANRPLTVWPVGYSNEFRVEYPRLYNGRLVDFVGKESDTYDFAMDYAGFAFWTKAWRRIHEGSVKFSSFSTTESRVASVSAFVESLSVPLTHIGTIAPWSVYVWRVETREPKLVDGVDQATHIKEI